MPDQDVAEILRKVQQIQIVANRSVDDLLAGQYRSSFRGRGMEFDEVREYQPGDDIRTIDWNVTARTGVPFIKRYCEERELTVVFLLDVSASGLFGSGNHSKLDVMVEITTLLMFSAYKSNDRVGLLLFADDVVSYFRPRKGKANVLRLIREMITATPVHNPTNLDSALQFISRVQRRRAVVFLISDFQGLASRNALLVSNTRHDLVAITLDDPRERELPNVGFLKLRDAETGKIVQVDTGRTKVRDAFKRMSAQRAEQLTRLLRRTGIDQLHVDVSEPYVAALRRFFDTRGSRQ